MTPQPPQPSPRLPSSLPIVALVFSVLGFCLPPLLIVGVIIGIVALIQNKGSLAAGIVAVILPVMAIPVIGILAAIAIPNFIKFQARSKQSECKMVLKQAYSAEMSYRAEKDEFSVHPVEVGFSPERGNRYLYAFDQSGPIAPNDNHPGNGDVGVGADTTRFPTISNDALREAIPARVLEQLGVRGKCPDCSITVACAGNIDNDPTVDVWTISSVERDGTPAGTPLNEVDDIRD
jgi:type II secretory pathway pseudopilin PulG